MDAYKTHCTTLDIDPCIMNDFTQKKLHVLLEKHFEESNLWFCRNSYSTDPAIDTMLYVHLAK